MEGEMPIDPCKQADHTQIVAKILKEAGAPRQSASVKEAFEKENTACVAPKTLGGNKGGKTRAAKARVSR